MDESLRLALVDFLNQQGEAPDPKTLVGVGIVDNGPASCSCCAATPTLDITYRDIIGHFNAYEIHDSGLQDLFLFLLKENAQ